ncbi:acyltransferase [Roseomonas sp. NAR14]|uniref:Acyltransferase n=1 Tax=Roseomonas acroporae TaxID=2937791 RepID=A0A9X1YBJ4_9PROT|nr:acyltransferase [Roseomonas acroporae]
MQDRAPLAGFTRDTSLQHVFRPDGIPLAAPGRIAELDALRGIAALGVLLYHFTSIYGRWIGEPYARIPEFRAGYFGVELFFVISGFVIVASARRAASLREFAWSRAARLLPAYWVAVLGTSAVLRLDPLHTLEAPTAAEILVNLTMLQDFLAVRRVDAVYWTLAQELAFYALLLAALRGAARSGLRLEWFCLLWLAAALAVRLSGAALPPPLATATLLHFGQFFIIGICLCVVLLGRPAGVTWLALGWALLMPALGIQPGVPAEEGEHYLPMTLGCAALFWAALRFRPRALSHPALLFLGRISYPLYLLHCSIGWVAMNALRADGLGEAAALLAAILVSLLLATAVHLLVERPAQRGLRALAGHGAAGVPGRGSPGIPGRSAPGVPRRSAPGVPRHGAPDGPGRGVPGASRAARPGNDLPGHVAGAQPVPP